MSEGVTFAIARGVILAVDSWSTRVRQPVGWCRDSHRRTCDAVLCPHSFHLKKQNPCVIEPCDDAFSGTRACHWIRTMC